MSIKVIIIADLIGKFLSLIYAIYFCKDIVLIKFNSLSFNILETIKNISVGIKLMFANIAQYTNHRDRQICNRHIFGTFSTFGKISLTLSISNLIILF